MAQPVIDPSRAKFMPEMLPEILNESSVSTTGCRIASYVLRDRRAVIENAHVFTQTANLDFVVSCDSLERARIRSNVYSLTDRRRYNKFVAKDTIDFSAIMTAGGPTANVRSGWHITFRKPLPVDKLREGGALDSNEETIADSVNLADNLNLGTIPYYQSLMNIDPAKMFDQVIPVEKSMAALAAGGEAQIGGSQIPANGNLIVLLGIMVDTTPLPVTPDDTFVVVDRDADADYIKIDVTGMPDNLYVPCYIPAVDKLDIRIESTTGSSGSTIPCGFLYGIRKLTVADYIRWEIGYRSPIARSESLALISRYPEVAKRIQAGLL